MSSHLLMFGVLFVACDMRAFLYSFSMLGGGCGD